MMNHNYCLSLPRVITITALFWITSLGAQPNLHVHQGSIESLQAEADRSQRPYLLYFYADWSEPCRQMESTTYQHGEVVDYLNDNFLFHGINVSTRGSNPVPSNYEVFLYPTIVICNPNGEVVNEVSGYIEPETLMQELKNVKLPTIEMEPAPVESAPGTPLLTASAEETPVKPQPIATVEIPSPEPEASPAPEKAPTQPEVAAPREEPSAPAQISVATKAVSAEVKPIAAPLEATLPAKQVEASLVVQVGVYGDYKNVETEIDRLQQSYFQPIRAVSGNLNGSNIHRVVVGPFASRGEAQQFLQRYQVQENRPALIKDLRNL